MFPPLLATDGRIHKGDCDMRTGAIFARGSCRALAWLLALGAATVLSVGEAAAQTVDVVVPDKLVLTPSTVEVDEGASESFTVQLKTKVVEVTATNAAARTDNAVEVTVTLARAATNDGANFIVAGIDTDNPTGAGTPVPIEAGGAITDGSTTLTWSFTLPALGSDVNNPTAPQVAGTLDPAGNKFVSVSADEDAGVANGSNTLVLASAFSYDHDGDAGTTGASDPLDLPTTRVTLVENDNDTIGVTVSTKTLTVLEGDTDGETYTVNLSSEPSHDVEITVEVKDAVNASISLAGVDADGKLTFTSTNWMTKQTVTVTAGTDQNLINGTATIKHTTESDDPAYNGLAVGSISVTELDSVRTITLTQSADTVMEGEAVTITATLESSTDTPVTLSGDVTVKLSGDGTKKFTGVTEFKISAGSTAGSTKLTAKQDANEDDEDVTLTASVSKGPAGIIEIPDDKVKIKITDDDEYTLEADKEEVDEGKEVMLTVKVTPKAAMETKVMIDLYRASGATVKVAEGQDADPEDDKIAIIDEGEDTAKFTLTTAKDANDSNDEVVVARAMAGGKVVGEPVTIMVRDTQAGANFTLSVDPDSIAEADGEASVMVTVMADKAVSADTTLTLAVDAASTAMDPDDYSIMPAEMMVMIDKGETMGMTTLMVTPVADSMDEPNETIVLTASMDDAQVGNAATLTLIDGDSADSGITVSDGALKVIEDAIMAVGGLQAGGEAALVDMSMLFDVADAGMMVSYMASSSDTDVLTLDTASTDATLADNYLRLTPMMEGMSTVTVMAEADGMMEVRTLSVVSCNGACVTANIDVGPAGTPVPALPLFGQGLLAAFLLAAGAYRRYRNR